MFLYDIISEGAEKNEIHNYEKLDAILIKLCKMILKGQMKDKEHYGMVAACVLDPDNQIVAALNYYIGNGKRVHAERAAIDKYTKKHGAIPKGSIIITTLSPCSEPMDERYSESCTDLINASGVTKVYCGYDDPTQHEEQREFNIMETSSPELRTLCQTIAETFLGNVSESWSKKYKKSINCNNPKGFSQKAHCAGRKKRQTGGKTKSSSVSENASDGKVKGKSRPGRVKRAGASCDGSVTSLRQKAKQGGERGKMYHWCANMKSGKKE